MKIACRSGGTGSTDCFYSVNGGFGILYGETFAFKDFFVAEGVEICKSTGKIEVVSVDGQVSIYGGFKGRSLGKIPAVYTQ